MDDWVGDLGVASVDPAEGVVGDAGGGEVGGAVGHADQVGGVQRAAEFGEAWAADGDADDVGCGDVAVSGGVGCGFAECVVGVTAGHQFDRHVGYDVPVLA